MGTKQQELEERKRRHAKEAREREIIEDRKERSKRFLEIAFLYAKDHSKSYAGKYAVIMAYGQRTLKDLRGIGEGLAAMPGEDEQADGKMILETVQNFVATWGEDDAS